MITGRQSVAILVPCQERSRHPLPTHRKSTCHHSLALLGGDKVGCLHAHPVIPTPALSFSHVSRHSHARPVIPTPALSFPRPPCHSHTCLVIPTPALSFSHVSRHSHTCLVIPTRVSSFPRRRESIRLCPTCTHRDARDSIDRLFSDPLPRGSGSEIGRPAPGCPLTLPRGTPLPRCARRRHRRQTSRSTGWARRWRTPALHPGHRRPVPLSGVRCSGRPW